MSMENISIVVLDRTNYDTLEILVQKMKKRDILKMFHIVFLKQLRLNKASLGM